MLKRNTIFYFSRFSWYWKCDRNCRRETEPLRRTHTNAHTLSHTETYRCVQRDHIVQQTQHGSRVLHRMLAIVCSGCVGFSLRLWRDVSVWFRLKSSIVYIMWMRCYLNICTFNKTCGRDRDSEGVRLSERRSTRSWRICTVCVRMCVCSAHV